MFGTSKYLILSLSYCKYTSIIISKCIEYWSETESYIANMIVLILHFEEEPDLFPALGKKKKIIDRDFEFDGPSMHS